MSGSESSTAWRQIIIVELLLPDMNNLLKFPDKFLWGTSTSAHQVEGNNHNQWSEWEKENAERLAKEAKNYWQSWQQEKFPEMFSSKNYISGRACDHYNRYEEDFNLVKVMNNNAHRFSIEWSRIEPEEGKFNEKEIEHYRQVIWALKKRGIEPFVTLWHWTIPLWFVEKGGFEKRENIKYFVRFCERIASEFKNDVKFWIVLNEPEIYTALSYLKGTWPPQKKNFFSYLKVLKNLIRTHRSVFEAIKQIDNQAQVGIAKNNIYFEGRLSPIIKWWWNFYFLNHIKNYQDFIGLNYYFHNRIKGLKFNQNENEKTSDLGWEIYPKGIYCVLKELKKYQKPIYITENGLADVKDEKREKFIKEHLYWIHKAIQEGVDVRGYFYWSLLDNFEWDKGFWPRFGLIEIDYQTMERKIRPSAQEYAKICKNNELIM